MYILLSVVSYTLLFSFRRDLSPLSRKISKTLYIRTVNEVDCPEIAEAEAFRIISVRGLTYSTCKVPQGHTGICGIYPAPPTGSKLLSSSREEGSLITTGGGSIMEIHSRSKRASTPSRRTQTLRIRTDTKSPIGIKLFGER